MLITNSTTLDAEKKTILNRNSLTIRRLYETAKNTKRSSLKHFEKAMQFSFPIRCTGEFEDT